MNAFENPNLIAADGLSLLKNHMVTARLINHEYKSDFNSRGTTGGVVSVRKPNQYAIRRGQQAQIQNIQDSLVQITVDKQLGADVAWSSADDVLSLDDFKYQVTEPQMITIANELDRMVLEKLMETPNAVGTAGTTPNTLLTYLQAGGKLNDEAVPKNGKRYAILDSTSEYTLVDALKGLFNNSRDISDQNRTGEMQTIGGLKFFMDQNVPTHTIGAYTGTPANGLVNGASQTGSSVITDTWTGSVTGLLKKNDVITFDGVYHVNPISKMRTKSLKQFRVTQDVNSSGGAATIPIYPPIVPTGARQNVSNVPADNAAIVVHGAASVVTPQNIVFHQDAATLVSVDLPLPENVKSGRAHSKDLGLSLRWAKFWDGLSDQFVHRFDVLVGIEMLRPEFAVRVMG